MASITTTINLVDNMSSKLDKINGKVDDTVDKLTGVRGGIDTLQTKVNHFDWGKFYSGMESVGSTMSSAGRKLTLGFTVPATVAGKKMYNLATDYETAATGVRKTVDATEEEYKALYDSMLMLSEDIPVDFVALNAYGEMAGQLGVIYDEILGFTGTYAGIEVSTNINGEEGAKDLARFMNMMDGSSKYVDRYGGVIVELGNNAATTEQEILGMGTRMAAAANLAGFLGHEVFAISTALSSFGINEEAGGSAMSKMMKQMDLAAEVGNSYWHQIMGEAADTWDRSAYDDIHDIMMLYENLKAADQRYFANNLGMTTDELERAMEIARDLEYFSQISGKTAQQFADDWNRDPAQAMVDFFKAVKAMDTSGVESAIALMEEMGITEIRKSNMFAAMAAQADTLENYLDMARTQFYIDPSQNALAIESGKFYGTQESQDKMLQNKAENTMADFGQNLVDALQPARDLLVDILDRFNALSEADQQKVVNTFLVFAAAGPVCMAVGNTVETIGKIGGAVEKIISSKGGWKNALSAMFGSNAFWGIAAGTGVVLLISYLTSIPTEMEKVIESCADIPITIDDITYNETLEAIRKVREEADLLKGGQITKQADDTSYAVKIGYGSNAMYGTALAYESALANSNIDALYDDYGTKLANLDRQIGEASRLGDTALADKLFEDRVALEADRAEALASERSRYAQQISAVFNGMASQDEELSNRVESMTAIYDAMAAYQALTARYYGHDDAVKQAKKTNPNFDAIAFEAEYLEQNISMVRGLLDTMSNLGYINDALLPMMYGDLDRGSIDSAYTEIGNAVKKMTEDVRDTVQAISDDEIMATWLKSILDDESITQNLDFTQISGAFEGLIKTLDLQNAFRQQEATGEYYGQFLTQGLATGIEDSTGVMLPAFENVRDATVDAICSVYDINSPSGVTRAEGIYLPQGLALGIEDGTGAVIIAITDQALQTLEAGRGILNAEAGASMGANLASGVVIGIQSGTASVVGAMERMMSQALLAAKNKADIHSPSGETAWMGEMLDAGLINGMEAHGEQVARAAEDVMAMTLGTWDDGVWRLIDAMSAVEDEDFRRAGERRYSRQLSDTDAKRMRELAEREVINQFHTAEVKVDFTANNTISSELDLDAIVEALEDRVTERLEAVAEGVYD